MFDAALLSGKGSDEYYRLIETAVKTYPDNPDANLNAAAAALERGDLESAEKYMEKADLSTPEGKNNMEYIKILKEKQ
jgi:Flp pilus assembly protein TadD